MTIRRRFGRPTSLAVAAALLAACDHRGPLEARGPDAAPPAPRGPSLSDSYLPLKVGARWVYQLHDTNAPGPSFTKTTTVEAYEPVGAEKPNVMAYRVRTHGRDGERVSWQEVRGSSVVRHREQEVLRGMPGARFAWEPYKIRLDFAAEHLLAEQDWSESFGESWWSSSGFSGQRTLVQKWKVEAVDEEVTVPAGTFRCLRIHVNMPLAGRHRALADNKVYWFARGVGKVKEVRRSAERRRGRIIEGGTVQELVSYHIP